MKRYAKALREYNVRKFIEENDYTPSIDQINDLRDSLLKTNPQIRKYGFCGSNLKKFGFQEKLSSTKENKNRDFIFLDLKTQKETIDNNYKSILSANKILNKDVDRLSAFLEKMESKINRLILLNSKADMFLYGVEDTFDNSDNINFEETDAQVEKGYVCLKKSRLESVSEDKYSVRYYCRGSNIIGETNSGGANALSRKDGQYFQYIAQTKNISNLIEFVLEYSFYEKTYIGDIKIVGNSIESNSKCYYDIEYSVDGEDYNLLKPGGKRFSSGENFSSLGLEVKKIKIKFKKNKADSIIEFKKTYLYMLTLDSIDFDICEYKPNSISTAMFGPYPVYNEYGDPINFSMATIANNTCCIIPEKTSVSFFLSKDGIDWVSAEYSNDKNASDIVKFGSLNKSSLLKEIDTLKEKTSLIRDDEVSSGALDELIYNFSIAQADLDKINLKNLRVERNSQSTLEVYGAKGGWFYNKDTGMYSCGFYIDSIEGRIIDLGNTSAVVDGYEKSGIVRLDEGYHTFKTSDIYWKDIKADIASSKELEEEDELYPYNHKLLIEGYSYPSNFEGEKLYFSLGRVFGSLLKYCPIEFFESSVNDGNLSIYTIERFDDSCYLKVKCLKEDSSWDKEKCSIIVQGQANSGNNIYVKAILKNSNTNVSPHINSISIRVI